MLLNMGHPTGRLVSDAQQPRVKRSGTRGFYESLFSVKRAFDFRWLPFFYPSIVAVAISPSG